MKIKLLFISLVILTLTSCIKDEPLYREADIVSIQIDDPSFVQAIIKYDVNDIQLVIGDTSIYKNITPIIEVSPGATITPASGIAMDFRKEVTYTVTSEDGKWSKVYTVTAVPRVSYKYEFEDWVMAGTGNNTYPALADNTWSSANSGVMLAKGGLLDRYPTRDTTLSVSGKRAALLETQLGGKKYWNNYISIFSGSLFRGVFSINLQEFAKSAKFGQIHPESNGKPILFTGYYIYRPGKEFLDKDGNIVSGKVDEFSLYAILYYVTKGDEGKEEFLDGTNIMSSDKVIARAEVIDHSEKKEFTQFAIPFTYYSEPDYDKYDYKLAVVFASSKDGAFYEGAPGSMLIVDDVEVVCEPY